MAHEYELRRLTDRIRDLSDEQKRINIRMLKSRRDEQFDIDHIRRRYTAIIYQLEERQQHVNKELERRQRDLLALQKRINEEAEEEQEKEESHAMKHHRRRL